MVVDDRDEMIWYGICRGLHYADNVAYCLFLFS